MNRCSKALILAVVLLLYIGRSSAQTCESIRTTKARIYGFHPAQLSPQQQEAKTNELDDFWSAVKQAGPDGVACLKGLLTEEKADGFFEFDGSSLLFSLDKSPVSLQTAADAIGSANLADIDTVAYLGFAMQLAHAGADIGIAARNYLHSPQVAAFLPQHSLQVDRSTGAIFLYGSMSSAEIDKHVIPELEAKEAYARNTAALILALNMTEPSLKALRQWSGRAALPPQEADEVRRVLHHATVHPKPATLTREQVLDRLRKLPQPASPSDQQAWEISAIATLTADDLEEIRNARRRGMRLSDEALYDYFELTKVLLAVINRLDQFGQYRVHTPAQPNTTKARIPKSR